MRKIFVLAAIVASGPALAQTSTVAPSSTAPQVTNHGSPSAANSGPGSTGTVSTEATGAGTISNNPAGAGNAQQPAKAGSTPSGSGSN